MLAFVGVLLIAGIIVMIELPSLRKKGSKKELSVFSVSLSIGIGLAIVSSMNLEIQSYGLAHNDF
ncbi:hypothetical protein [Pseudalkalibacillus decolorationis]|uniref:hypothetical protein n=1 Tax=Pseudalkalibacillus decolorationis TaxID=163879 RepID=UPI002148CF75|nr:hypothetical protein [Pseudalkalibacillus decolorationis]